VDFAARRLASYGNLRVRATVYIAGTPVPNAMTPYFLSEPNGPALTPEVIDPRIANVEILARWLDYAFELPNGFRFGLAGFIGLIPGIGNIIDALVSLYIIYRSIQLGIPGSRSPGCS